MFWIPSLRSKEISLVQYQQQKKVSILLKMKH